MHQSGPCGECGGLQRLTIVLVVDDGVGDIPVLQRLEERSRIAVGIDGQHEQLADLLLLRQMIDIRVDAPVKAGSRRGCLGKGG